MNVDLILDALVFLPFLLTLSVDSKTILSRYFARRHEMENKKYTVGLLQQEHVKRRLSCMFICIKEKRCNNVMYNTWSNECRLYQHKHDENGTQEETHWQCWGDKNPSSPQNKWEYDIKEHGHLHIHQFHQNMTLHQACEQGNLDMVRYIVSKKRADINGRGKFGRTPLMMAARNGHVDVFNYLVSLGCNLSVVDDRNTSLLHLACMANSTDILQRLRVKEHCNKDREGQNGWTPVMLAAAMGHKKVFDILVSKGCVVAGVDSSGDNILHLACVGGNPGIVDYILKQGIFEIDCRGYNGGTPAMTAAEMGHRKIIDLLIRRGCNLNATNDHGSNILHAACVSGNVDIVKFILSLNIFSIESRGRNGFTPVMTAAVKGHIGVVEFLVGKRCNAEAVDSFHLNMLHSACIAGRINMINYILSQKLVDKESKGYKDRTPLLIAARLGQKEVVKFLLGKNCNKNVVDIQGNNMLHLACVDGNVDMVKYILMHKLFDIECKGHNGRTALMTAVFAGHTGLVEFLLSKGCNREAVDREGNSILHIACMTGNLNMVSYIMSHKLVHIESRGYKGRTPVMEAARMGKKRIVKFLLGKGCNGKVVDTEENTILHVACLDDNTDVVNYILSHKLINIESRGYKGQTPVITAAEMGHRRIVELLIKEGCDLNAADNEGNTVLRIACYAGRVDMLRYLLTLKGIDKRKKKNFFKLTPAQILRIKGGKGFKECS